MHSFAGSSNRVEFTTGLSSCSTLALRWRVPAACIRKLLAPVLLSAAVLASSLLAFTALESVNTFIPHTTMYYLSQDPLLCPAGQGACAAAHPEGWLHLCC
jgi:hypothetical protein